MARGDNPNSWLKEAVVVMGGMTFATHGAPDPVSGLYMSGLTGWFGLPEIKGSATGNPVFDGNLPRTPDQLRRSSRVLSITGSVSADTYGKFNALRDRFINRLSRDGLTLSLAMPGLTPVQETLELMVEVDSVKLEADRAKPSAKFTIDLVAQDPYKRTPTTVHPPLPNLQLRNLMEFSAEDYPDGGDLLISITDQDGINRSVSISFILWDVPTLQNVRYTITLRPELTPGIKQIDINPNRREVTTDTGEPVRFKLSESGWPSLVPIDPSGIARVNAQMTNEPVGVHPSVVVSTSLRTW